MYQHEPQAMMVIYTLIDYFIFPYYPVLLCCLKPGAHACTFIGDLAIWGDKVIYYNCNQLFYPPILSSPPLCALEFYYFFLLENIG